MLENITSWFTPTILFCLVNVVIGTIFLSNKKPGTDSNPAHPLARAPSLVDRVRSINFSLFDHEHAHDPTRPQSQSLLQRVRSIGLNSYADSNETTQSQSLIDRVRAINLSWDHDQGHDTTHTPSFIERVKSIKFSPFNSEESDPPRSNQFDYNHNEDTTQTHAQSPSILQRVRSIKLSPFKTDQSVQHNSNNYNHDYDHDEDTVHTEIPSLLQRVKSIKLSPFKNTEQQPIPARTRHHRAESEAKPKTRKSESVAKMKKSASAKMVAPETEDSPELRRPATVRDKKTAGPGGDEEVDERADDFINKFKQQLKLQRLDSMMRYKEMLNRGT